MTRAAPMVTPGTTSHDAHLLECHECGLFQRARPAGRGKVVCARCGYKLYNAHGRPFDVPLAFYLAAIILFVVANTYPFMTFSLQSREQRSNLITGVFEFMDQGLWFLAIVVFAMTIAMPAVRLFCATYVLLALRAGRRGRRLGRLYRLNEIVRPWAMLEVFLLGVLVAYVKLIDLATIEVGVAVIAFGLLIVVMAAADASLEPHDVWNELGYRGEADLAHGGTRGLMGCHVCGLVSRHPPSAAHADCPRCSATLHHRKPNSLTWAAALTLTGFFLYIPANIFPVMTVISFGRGEADTILSGVIHLAEAGMWPLALLVLVASITVPMAKLFGMAFLLLSVRRGSRWRLRDRTVLYRVIEFIGRWSMIDIFMIAILIALVKLDSIATIEPGVGATSFAGVVIVTMIAAMMFDSRLIWDAAGENDAGH